MLANLLWSEFSDDQARNNLRTTLSNLNGLVSPHLTIEREPRSAITAISPTGWMWMLCERPLSPR